MYSDDEQRAYRMSAGVGTEFVVNKPWSDPYISRVEKSTKARLMIDGYTFNRENGKQIGGSSWCMIHIQIPTEEQRAICRHISLVKHTEARLENTKKYLKSMTDEELMRIYKTLTEAKDAVFVREKEKESQKAK